MQYSIRGNILLENKNLVNVIIMDYTVSIGYNTDLENKIVLYEFEVWVNTLEEKNSVFNSLKKILSNPNEWIDWHECYHNENINSPCVISEKYTIGDE